MHLKALFDEREYGPPSAARFTSPSPAHLVRHDEFTVSPSNSFMQQVSVPLRVDDLRHLSLSEQEEEIEVWFETERGEPSIGLAPHSRAFTCIFAANKPSNFLDGASRNP